MIRSSSGLLFASQIFQILNCLQFIYSSIAITHIGDYY